MSWRSCGNRGASQITGVLGILSDTVLQSICIWSGPESNIVTKRTWSLSCHAAKVVCKGRTVLRDLLLLFRFALHWNGCLQRALNWAFSCAKMLIYQVKAVSSEKTMRCHSYLHHLPSSKKGWLINQILWTLPSSWRSCWNLTLTSRPTIMDIFDITDDDSTLEGEQAIFDKHDEDVSLPSVRILLLIRTSHVSNPQNQEVATPAEVSCIHCQGKQTSATPVATLRLLSRASRCS